MKCPIVAAVLIAAPVASTAQGLLEFHDDFACDVLPNFAVFPGGSMNFIA